MTPFEQFLDSQDVICYTNIELGYYDNGTI